MRSMPQHWVQLRRALTIGGTVYPPGAVVSLSADVVEILAARLLVLPLPAGAPRRK